MASFSNKIACSSTASFNVPHLKRPYNHLAEDDARRLPRSVISYDRSLFCAAYPLSDAVYFRVTRPALDILRVRDYI